MNKLLIGIDPDIEKSGVCYYFSKENFKLYNLTFFELFTTLKQTEGNVKAYIEAGWLNKSNWHKVANGSAAINASIGLRTGANHEVGRKIVEMCEYLEVEYVLVKPTKSKINSDKFNKNTGHKGRSNQEQRDACMLVFGK
jgi:hypothetical protein